MDSMVPLYSTELRKKIFIYFWLECNPKISENRNFFFAKPKSLIDLYKC